MCLCSSLAMVWLSREALLSRFSSWGRRCYTGVLKTVKYSNLGLASEIQKASMSEQAGSPSCFSGMPSRYLRTVKQRKEESQ